MRAPSHSRGFGVFPGALVAAVGFGMLVPLALATPAAAAPPVVQCGVPIPAGVTEVMDRDLGCPLELGNEATLDMAGYRLVGDGTGKALTWYSAGATSTSSVNVRNGTISGWEQVYGDWDGPGIRLSNVTVTQTAAAFVGFHAVVSADHSVFADNDTVVSGGIVGVTVTDSRFRRNQVAIAGSFAGYIRVAGSSFTDNGTAIHCGGQALEVAGSTFTRNDHAISVSGCSASVITDNTFRRNDAAYVTRFLYPCGPCGGGAETQLLVDDVSGNSLVSNATAVDVEHSARVAGNAFRLNGTALRSVVNDDIPAPTVEASGNSFSRNGDAVYLTNPSRVGDNTVMRNTGWGIYAPGATDLGGNVATRNGSTPQCVGVVCSRR